jgi:hypothetical protein
MVTADPGALNRGLLESMKKPGKPKKNCNCYGRRSQPQIGNCKPVENPQIGRNGGPVNLEKLVITPVPCPDCGLPLTPLQGEVQDGKLLPDPNLLFACSNCGTAFRGTTNE